MCNYSDFVEQQGLKKGREEGHLESLSESVLRKSKTKSKTSKLLISMRRAALTVVSFSGIRKLILSSKRT